MSNRRLGLAPSKLYSKPVYWSQDLTFVRKESVAINLEEIIRGSGFDLGLKSGLFFSLCNSSSRM